MRNLRSGHLNCCNALSLFSQREARARILSPVTAILHHARHDSTTGVTIFTTRGPIFTTAGRFLPPRAGFYHPVSPKRLPPLLKPGGEMREFPSLSAPISLLVCSDLPSLSKEGCHASSRDGVVLIFSRRGANLGELAPQTRRGTRRSPLLVCSDLPPCRLRSPLLV